MAAYASPVLPIPQVREISRLEPPHDHLHICVSTFVHGEPIEAATAEQWKQLVPVVADLLDAMRAIEPPPGSQVLAWRDVLLAADRSYGRLHDWQQKLASFPDLAAGYDQGVARLGELCEHSHVAEVSPTLLHCDLINRNVHVVDGEITGVFDWGCRRWGDHLYELAWFEFWAPWYLDLDVELLRRELTMRWGAPPDPDRLAACSLHIAVEHLVYNAAVDQPDEGRHVLVRMRDLGLLSGTG